MFYLSKILWAAAQPSALIAILLAGGLFVRAAAKRTALRLIGAGAALYVVMGYSPLANWLLIPLEHRYPPSSPEELAGAAGIIVLGGAVNGALDIGDGRPILNESADRMIEAVRLAQRNPQAPVIFTGGSNEVFSIGAKQTEAEYARRFFEGFDIGPPRLKLEDRSRNTLENAVFTAKLLQPRPDQSFALVTSASHMPRARALFEAQGFRILPAPADFRTRGPRDGWRFFASASEGLRRTDIAAREWAGLFVSWLRGDIAWPPAP
jgi:uncharacterized SAM-binding protein YcdF (DUF218 family)